MSKKLGALLIAASMVMSCMTFNVMADSADNEMSGILEEITEDVSSESANQAVPELMNTADGSADSTDSIVSDISFAEEDAEWVGDELDGADEEAVREYNSDAYIEYPEESPEVFPEESPGGYPEEFPEEAPEESMIIELLLDMPVQLPASGETAVFAFTPEHAGTYRLFSYGSDTDTYAAIYDSADRDNQLMYDDGSGDDGHFSLICNLEAGVTYYCEVFQFSGHDPSCNVMLTEVQDITKEFSDVSDEGLSEEGPEYQLLSTETGSDAIPLESDTGTDNESGEETAPEEELAWESLHNDPASRTKQTIMIEAVASDASGAANDVQLTAAASEVQMQEAEDETAGEARISAKGPQRALVKVTIHANGENNGGYFFLADDQTGESYEAEFQEIYLQKGSTLNDMNRSYTQAICRDPHYQDSFTWSLFPGEQALSSDTVLDQDTVLYVVWTRCAMITYEPGEGKWENHSSAISIPYLYGSVLKGSIGLLDIVFLLKPDDQEKAFAGWSTEENDPDGEHIVRELEITEDRTLYAVYKEGYRVTLDFGDCSFMGYMGGQYVSNDHNSFVWVKNCTLADYSSPLYLSIVPKKGYNFTGFGTSRDESSLLADDYTPTGDTTLYAVLTEGTEVCFLPGEGAFAEVPAYMSDRPMMVFIRKGQKIGKPLTPVPPEGKVFTGWMKTDGNSQVFLTYDELAETVPDLDTYDENTKYTAVYESATAEPDFSIVDRALAAVPEDLGRYTPETRKAVQDAVAAVDRTTVSQAVVDNMAKAINDAVKGLKVAVTGIKLDKTTLSLEKGSSQVILKATVLPADAADKIVRWTSSDTSLVTVDKNGRVSVNPNGRAGSAVITAMTVSGGKTAGCTVKVYFSDVPAAHAYQTSVYWAAGQGITGGMGSTGFFGVNDSITRGQVVTFLWRAAGKPEPWRNTQTFTDVPTGHAFYKAIQWASEMGITGGYTGARAGQFGPDDPCARGQIATFLWRYAGKPAPAGSTQTFTDVSVKHSFYKAIQWASENRITAGYSDGTFGVNRTCTRGHCVTFLYRLIGY